MTSLQHTVFLSIRMAAYTSNKYSLASTRLRCIPDSTLPAPLHSSTPAPFHARCALLLPRGSPTSSLGLLPPPSLRQSDDSSPARRGYQEGMSGAASWSHGRNRGPPGARLRRAAASQGGAHGRCQLPPVAGSAVAWSNPGRSTSAPSYDDLFGNPAPVSPIDSLFVSFSGAPSTTATS